MFAGILVDFQLHVTHCLPILVLLALSSRRYELCFSGEKPRSIGSNSNASDLEPEKHQNNSHHHLQNGDRGATEHELRDVFRWSRCKKAMPEVAMRSIGIPLPAEQVEVVSLYSKAHTILSFFLHWRRRASFNFVVCYPWHRRCCRTIWSGRTCSGRRPVSGFLGRSIRSPACISSRRTSDGAALESSSSRPAHEETIIFFLECCCFATVPCHVVCV
jgi:hypothetical protein